jgi:hypothetical protein
MGNRSRTRVHLRTVTVRRRQLTVLSPRPDHRARFATNYYHETWHVLTSTGGARYLARVCWAMAYQRKPGTVFLIGPNHIVGNPFDADPSCSIVVHNCDLGSFSRAEATVVQRHLPWRSQPERTVTLHTHGLTQAAQGTGNDRDWEPSRWNAHQQRCWISRTGGLVILAGTAPVLRSWAVMLSSVGSSFFNRSDEVELNWPDGEVQVLQGFTKRVTAAAIARSRLFPGREHEELSRDERAVVWSAPRS